MKTLGAFLVCCSVAGAEIIHGTATAVVSSHHYNRVGGECLQLGDTFSIEFVSQIDLDGFGVDSRFTGLVNGNYDGVPDWSTRFQIHNWPPRENIWIDGLYSRRVGGQMDVNNVHSSLLEWQWGTGLSSFCAGYAGPARWSWETMYHDGDADQNGLFDSSDLVKVFVAGQYEDGIERNSTWATGDWTGDREFDSSDLVAAMITGRYGLSNASAAEPVISHSSIGSDAIRAIPEPSGAILLGLGALGLLFCRRI